MQDDRQDTTLERRDVLGELIRAAGRREAPPAEAYEEVLAASQDAWQRKVRSRRQRRWSYALAAGVATLAIGIAVFLQIDPLGPRPIIAATAVLDGRIMALTPGAESWHPLADPDTSLVAGTRLRTQNDGRVALDLARGVSLRIDRESELTLVSPEHIELTAGTIYVDSGLGVRTNRFEITTPFGIVRDIGTQFEVRSSAAALRVRVREGLVELYQDNDAPQFSGTAGEEYQIDNSGAIRRAPFSIYDPEWSWAIALASAPQTDGQSVLGFLNWVARETGRALRFSEPGAEAQAETVILHIGGLPPLEALEVMRATTDFDYSLQDDGVLLIRRR